MSDEVVETTVKLDIDEHYDEMEKILKKEKITNRTNMPKGFIILIVLVCIYVLMIIAIKLILLLISTK